MLCFFLNLIHETHSLLSDLENIFLSQFEVTIDYYGVKEPLFHPAHGQNHDLRLLNWKGSGKGWGRAGLFLSHLLQEELICP